MPRATLIHNLTAGDGQATPGALRALVAEHGFTVDYATTDDDLDEALQDPGDLVVAAGGDGTVGKVATRLLGRGVPLAVLALGTANNVARGLGLPADGGPAELAFDWGRARHRRLDIGVVRGPWGTRHFIESFGVGFIGHAMPILSALKSGEDGPSGPEAELEHDRRALAALLDDYRPIPLELVVDGQRRPGEWLGVEALNIPSLGPNLYLAPDADPSDGRLDLVLAGEEDRGGLVEWLEAGGPQDDRPPAPTHRVESVSIHWRGEPLHLDGRPWGDLEADYEKVRTAAAGGGSEVRVSLEPEGVPVLVPEGAGTHVG